MKYYSRVQFLSFRIFLGLYLAIHFANLIPYAGELFSRDGVVRSHAFNLTSVYFPNLLFWIDSTTGVIIFLGALTLLSVTLVTGFWRVPVSLVLWYGYACLFNRNNLVADPSLAYVGWVLLACALVPPGENRLSSDWKFPRLLFYAAWLIIGVGYLVSGIAKLKTPMWVDGSALSQLLNHPQARDDIFRRALYAMPPAILKMGTWLVLAIELLFLPLAAIPRTRFFIWLAAIFLNIMSLFMFARVDLTIGFLVCHWLIWDPLWFAPKVKSPETIPIVFFDGVCGLCNRTLDWLLQMDVYQVLRYAPLQGPNAKKLLGEKASWEGDPESIIFYVEGKTYFRSRGILRAMWAIGGVYRPLIAPLFLIPAPLADAVYDWIARNRYKWFGKLEVCRLPTRDERPRFLD